MTAQSNAGRFCSCSDSPSQPKDASSGSPANDSVSDADVRIESEVGESDSRESEDNDGRRFCSCSEEPVRQLAVESDRDESQNASGEVDERQSVEDSAPETSTSKSGADANSAGAAALKLSSVSDLLPDETAIDSVSTHDKGGSEVVLTNRRVLLRGAPEAKVLHASMPLSEIDSLSILRARPRKRSLVWGLIGIGTAIGIWQALDGVGNMRLIVAGIVLLMAWVMLADYFIRPPGLEVVFRSRSGTAMTIEFSQGRAKDADRFAAQVLANRENLHPQ